MKTIFSALGLILLAALAVVFYSACYVVNEWDHVLLTQFGKPVGKVKSDPGLHFKTPFIQTINRIEKRILEWDGAPVEMPTRDKLYVSVDTFARWEISDPTQYFISLRDERTALSRLDDLLGSETRSVVARHDLIEMIRTDKDRKPEVTGEITQMLGQQSGLDVIKVGRAKLEKEIFANAAPKLAGFGIKLLDLKFKRINYNPSVEARIFERMVSERRQIAERFRSEGAGQAARIIGDMEREVRGISSEAYKKVETIKGEADAKATAIYANSYNGSASAREFYTFQKTLETYGKVFDEETSMILSTDSDLLRLLKTQKPAPATSQP